MGYTKKLYPTTSTFLCTSIDKSLFNLLQTFLFWNTAYHYKLDLIFILTNHHLYCVSGCSLSCCRVRCGCWPRVCVLCLRSSYQCFFPILHAICHTLLLRLPRSRPSDGSCSHCCQDPVPHAGWVRPSQLRLLWASPCSVCCSGLCFLFFSCKILRMFNNLLANF